MKKMNVIAGLFLTFVFTSFILTASESEPQNPPTKMPDNVKAIIDKSCFACHNSDSENEDAREELNFTTFDKLSKIGKIGALKHIGETVEEGEMPPRRFLERNPDKKLTENEVKVLTDWVKKEATALVDQQF